MSFTLDLGGNFPYADGTIISDVSRYVGNNTFVRVISQTNNNKIMAGLYTVDDPYSPAPTVTTVHEQVLDNTVALYNPRIIQLGNGSFLVSYNPNVMANVPKFTIFKYDNVLGQFIIEVFDQPYYYSSSDHTFGVFTKLIHRFSHLSISYTKTSYNIYPYGNNSLIYMGVEDGTSDYLRIGIINNVYGTDSTTRDIKAMSSNSGAYVTGYYPDYVGFNEFGTKLVITISNDNNAGCLIFDMETQTAVSTRSNISDVAMLDNDRLLTISSFQGENEVRYGLGTDTSSIETASVRFSPTVNVSYDPKQHRRTLSLDRFHAIHFRTNNGSLRAHVFKIMDGDYAYVSDATTTGVLVLSHPIFSYSAAAQTERSSCMIDGEWLKRIDENRFYIQTGYNEYTFFEISPTPAT